MKTTLRAISLLTFVLSSCGDSKENATQHFDSVQQAIIPFVESTDKMMKEIAPVMMRYRDTRRKLDPADSLIILKALDSFNLKSAETLNLINNIEDFKEFDLKKPTSECVERLSKLIQMTLGDTLAHPYAKDMTPEQLENLKTDFQKEALAIQEYYFQTQDEFQRKYGIE